MFKGDRIIEKLIPSIFNDVIGPVMRGPSSSHCAGALRIGRIARDLMNGSINEVFIQFDPRGSLATTHESQGSDMGLFAGLLGWDASDDRLPDSKKEIENAGIDIKIEISPFGASHPNTYKMILVNPLETHEMIAISTGGGIIEVIEIDGFSVNIAGDYFETLIFTNSDGKKIESYLEKKIGYDFIHLHTINGKQLIEIKGQKFPDEQLISDMRDKFDIMAIRNLFPVLPVLSSKNANLPFASYTEMGEYNEGRNLPLWELALIYECARSNSPETEVLKNMADVLDVMQNAVSSGVKGTEYKDRILGNQSKGFRQKMDEGKLLNGGILNRMILYISAVMEVKSAMGLIVAAPTAGSCGTLPGTILAAAEMMDFSNDYKIRALLAAGMIGVFIAQGATFAAESGGCQAECGSASGMTAAALVSLLGGSAKEALDAASMALQNTMGMTCDPVANRVEVPCLGKNIIAGSNAIACANMSMAGYDSVIPLDQVIETMSNVGKCMPVELRCTALGGLSITPASREIEKNLRKIP